MFIENVHKNLQLHNLKKKGLNADCTILKSVIKYFTNIPVNVQRTNDPQEL